MRVKRTWGVLSLWLVASPAVAAEREVLIWGGGSKPEEAQALEAELREKPAQLPDGLGLAVGFPRLIESQSMQGLKPGFHVVILGFCTKPEAKEVLAALKAKRPGVYARSVTVPEESANTCPLLTVSSPVSAEDLKRALKPLEKEHGAVEVLAQSRVDAATGRLAALVRFKGRKGGASKGTGETLVALANTPKGLKVLGSMPLDPGEQKVEMRAPRLVRIAPREVAAELLFSSHEPDTTAGGTGVETHNTELVLYHLTANGPNNVLSFEVYATKSDVECTSTTEADYEAVENELHEGFYPLRVETTTSDGGCARIYWDRSQGEPPEDLGTTRTERLYRWDGSTYR